VYTLSLDSIVAKKGVLLLCALLDRETSILNLGDASTNIWKNEDSKMMLIKEIMEMFPNLQRARGRVKGKQYEASIANYSSKELVNELRKRGYKVSAIKEIITVEEL
jgi:hypothetical protein